jgi:hypothetical protein
MKIDLFAIILAAIYMISASFWGVMSFPIPTQDGILILSFFVLLFYIKYFDKKSIYEDRNFHYFLWYGFLASIVMAYLNFGQPVIYSMRAARILVIYSILIMALNIFLKNFQLKKAYPFIIFISFLIIFLNIYVYATGDTSFLVDGVGVLKRLGEIRVTIGTFSSIVFAIFFFHKIKDNKAFLVPLLGLLFVMIVVSKTRSVVFPVLIIMLIPLLRIHKAQVIKVWMIFTAIVLLSLVFSDFEKSILSPIIDLVNLLISESHTVKRSNINIRGIELAYFWHFLDVKSMIFGYGMANTQFKELYDSHYYLSDIGLFNVFYYHGVIGSILFIMMHWRLYKVSKVKESALHLTGRGIVYFQILSLNSVFLYSPEYMVLFFIMYILIKNDNKTNIKYKKG